MSWLVSRRVLPSSDKALMELVCRLKDFKSVLRLVQTTYERDK